MKRPELYTFFSPCAPDPVNAARGLLAALPDGDRGFALTRYFGEVVHEADFGFYGVRNEEKLFETPEQLLELVRQHKGGMWTCISNLRFHYSDIYAYHYFAQDDPDHLHTAICTDANVTRFLEDATAARGDYLVFLSRVATALNADYLISGVNMEGLVPISPSALLSEAGFKATLYSKPAPFAYILGWRDELFDAAQIATGWGLDLSDVQRTLDGYAFLHRLPTV